MAFKSQEYKCPKCGAQGAETTFRHKAAPNSLGGLIWQVVIECNCGKSTDPQEYARLNDDQRMDAMKRACEEFYGK